VFSADGTTVKQVGTVTFALRATNSARLTYVVDGATVARDISRQTWRDNHLGGTYLGASIGTISNCDLGIAPQRASSATFAIEHDGRFVTIHETGRGYACTYSGAYAQAGRKGSIAGGGSCSFGALNRFEATDIEVSALGFAAAMRARFEGCVYEGRIGGIRK
jgi:hypothetical protein